MINGLIHYVSLYSVVDLSHCIGLQYLDISNNQLTEIVGLEGLLNLKMLKCNGNLIQNNSGFRTLSFNTQLVSLDVAQNPVSEANYQDVRVYIHNLLPSLKTLDGNLIRNNQIGYTENVQPLMKRNSSVNVTDQQTGSAPAQLPISAMSSPTCSTGILLPRTPAGQQQQSGMAHSYLDHYSSHSKSTMSSHSLSLHQDAQNVEPNIQAVPNDNTRQYEHQKQEEMDEAYDELMENRYVSNSRLPWRNPPNPLPREYASRPWLTDSIASSKREEYDRTKSPINYALQLRKRSDAQDVSSVGPSNLVGSQSMGAMSRKELDVRSEKSITQHHDMSVSNLSIRNADVHIQHHSTHLPLLPTEISTFQVDGRTIDLAPADTTQAPSLNPAAPQNSITSGVNAVTLLAKTQQSFRYSNPKSASALRSYAKAYQKTVGTVEKSHSKNPKMLPHQQPHDGVYPSPVSTPLHDKYPSFYTLRGNEDDAEMYTGLEDNITTNPQMKLSFGGPEMSPLSRPHEQPHKLASSSSAPTLIWMAPSLRSPSTNTGNDSLSLPTGQGANGLEGKSNAPVWDILKVAKRWDIRSRGSEQYVTEQRSGRGRSRSPHPTHFTPDSLLHQSHNRLSYSQNRSRSHSPTKASVLRAEYIKNQQFEQEHKKQLDELPPQRPRFVDTYFSMMVPADDTKNTAESLHYSKEDGERGRSRSISRSRIRRSNLENLMSPTLESTNRDRSVSARSDSGSRSRRPSSRSKSPYQNLMDLKSRIRDMLNNETEYFEAKRQERHHELQQQHLQNRRESREFEFIPGDLAAPVNAHALSGTRGNQSGEVEENPVNSSFRSVRSNRSNISASNSLVMMPTVASRNMLRHPENVVKSSSALSKETKTGLANPHSKLGMDRLKTGELRSRAPMRPPGSAPASTKKVTKNIKGKPAMDAKRSVTPVALYRNKSATQEAISHSHSHGNVNEAKKHKNDEEMVFMKRMNECLQMFESAAANLSRPQQQPSNTASVHNNALNMEQMMGAGFVLYEQLVRKRAQLIHDIHHSSPFRYGTDPAAMQVSTPSSTDNCRNGHLARESEHVLRALQRYMLDILEREDKHGLQQALDPQLLAKLRSLTPNKDLHRSLVHPRSEENSSYDHYTGTAASSPSKIEKESNQQLLAEELKSISQVIDGLKTQNRRLSGSLSPPPPPPPPPLPVSSAQDRAETYSPGTQIPIPLQRSNSNRTISTATTQATSSTNNTPIYAATNAVTGRPIPSMTWSRRQEINQEDEDDEGIVIDAHGQVVSQLSRAAFVMNVNNARQDTRQVATTLLPTTASTSSTFFSSPAVAPTTANVPVQQSPRVSQQSVTDTARTSSFLSPIAESAGVSLNNSYLNQASHFTFDQSVISQAATSAGIQPNLAESNATISMQAMAIGSLIAQLSARQKESLSHLQQQRHRSQPIPSPSNSVNSVFINSTPIPYKITQTF